MAKTTTGTTANRHNNVEGGGGGEKGETPSSPSTSPTKWAQREAFFFNHGANIAAWTLFLSLNVGFAVWGVWQFTKPHWTTTSDVLRITLPIARAGGRLVTLNIAILLVTACKYFWTLIRQYTIIPYGFPVDNIMPDYHRIVAWTIIFSGCVVHTIPQIINYSTKELVIIDDKPVWTFGDGFATKQLLYTGCLLTIIFTLFYFTTLQKVRHTTWGFRIFWITHLLGIVTVLPLLIIHGTLRGYPILLYFIVGPLALYLADSIIRRIVYVSREAMIEEIVPYDEEGEKVVKLVLQCRDFIYTPGQYAELYIPEISYTEWHPFTIASAPTISSSGKNKGYVVFYIKAAGRWTNKLHELATSLAVQNNNKKKTKKTKDDKNKSTMPLPSIAIRGPHGAPAQNYLAYRHLIVIGSGIGVTPLLSVWQYLVNAGSKVICEPATDKRTEKKKKSKKNGKDSVEKSGRKKENAVETEEEFLDRTANETINSVDVVGFAKMTFSTFRGKCAYYSSMMESMTVNICLFCFSVSMETLVFSVWVYQLDVEAAIIQLIASFIALSIFGSKMILSVIAYGPTRYLQSWVFFLEFGILLMDVGSIVSSFGTVDSPTHEEAVVYFATFAAFLLLHAVRIFHIFHCTARPPPVSPPQRPTTMTTKRQRSSKGITKQRKSTRKPRVEKVHSITGIWVSKYYASMSFAAMDLVKTLDGISPVFTLLFYGTRERSNSGDKGIGQSEKVGNHQVIPGRPDWESIFHTAIAKAHATTIIAKKVADNNNKNKNKNNNDDDDDNVGSGEAVGVFFCGSPAIARVLQTTSQYVTAQHQYETKLNTGTPCRCRILVHKENF